jgi:hypothetical protein
MNDELAQALEHAGASIAERTELPEGERARLRELVIEIGVRQRYDLFAAAARLGQRLNALVPALDRDLAFQRSLAFLCWVANDAAQSIAASKRALRIDTNNAGTYTMLAWAHLTANEPTEAFLALSAGRFAAPGDNGVKAWHRLAEFMARGIRQVEFDLDGAHYQFELTCFDGQAMESSLKHAHATLPELAELRFLREAVGSAKVIVEVGTLVGNHTVYFARNLAPEKIYAFDANPRSAAQTVRNFRLNFPEGQPPALVMVQKAVGDGQRTIQFAGESVEMTTLTAEVPEKVDFMKIDVDGMELGVLAGARALLLASRPRLFIEVKKDNGPAFSRFLDEVGYRVAHKFERSVDINFFAVPAPGAG